MDKASELALDFVWRLMNGKPIQEVDVRAPSIGSHGVFHLYCNCKSEFPNFQMLEGPSVPDTISALEDLPPEVSLYRTEIFREEKMMHVWMGVCGECGIMYYGRTEPGPIRVQREFKIEQAVDQDVVILRDRTTGQHMRISGLEWQDLRDRNKTYAEIWTQFSGGTPRGQIEIFQDRGIRPTATGSVPMTSPKKYLADGYKNYNLTEEELKEAREILTKAYKEQRQELAKQTLYKQPVIDDKMVVYYDGLGKHDGKRMVHNAGGSHAVVNKDGSTTIVPEVTTCPVCREIGKIFLDERI